MSIGGGSNKSSSSQSSTSNSQSFGSNVWGNQSPFLQDLYARANQNFGNLGDANMNTALLGNAGNIDAALAEQTLGRSNAAYQSFLNPTVDPAFQAYSTNLGQQFREQFLPELQGQAALAGGLGGSRQQIGSALGAQRAMQTLGDFAAQSYAGQQDRALQASAGLASNAGAFGDLTNLRLGQADFARSMPWYNLSQYQGLLGAPVMQDLGSYSKTVSKGSGGGSGWNANAGLGGG